LLLDPNDSSPFGHEGSFARIVNRTFSRRLRPANGHSIREVDRCFFGMLRPFHTAPQNDE
jgi:hypothetical protein